MLLNYFKNVLLFLFSFTNLKRKISKSLVQKDLKIVGTDNEKSRTRWVVTKLGDLKEEISFSVIIAPSGEIVSAIPRIVSNAEGLMCSVAKCIMYSTL